ncbi:MAG: hypothetical protein K2G19_10070, partial [Lachnospiraceae bacterium]|nr:hypothetical protein [Lachnospiraceae bacterium]
MTGPAEILLEDGDASFLKQQEKEGKIPVIYGEYGILVPVMEKERNLDPGHILPEETNMADIVLDLLSNDEKLKKYQRAAADRARKFTFESYVEQFLKLGDAEHA